jgi:hypothetical protein
MAGTVAARNNETPCTGGTEAARSYRWPTRSSGLRNRFSELLPFQ